MTLIHSDGVRTSRRLSSATMLSGCGSYMRTRMYRCFASYATFAVVRMLGTPSSFGSKTRKPSISCAFAQIGSSSRAPSVWGAVARAAIAITSFTPAGFSSARPTAGTAAAARSTC